MIKSKCAIMHLYKPGHRHLTLISIVTTAAELRGLTLNPVCVCECVCVCVCVFIQLGDGIDGIPPMYPWEWQRSS